MINETCGSETSFLITTLNLCLKLYFNHFDMVI
uniref:Uncharacterized protein n=1 Tax=Rhizophora mucronata TaxID=61149 RepID=A0A2P2NJ39_RHIMU